MSTHDRSGNAVPLLEAEEPVAPTGGTGSGNGDHLREVLVQVEQWFTKYAPTVPCPNGREEEHPVLARIHAALGGGTVRQERSAVPDPVVILRDTLANIVADCETAAERRTPADWDFAVVQAAEKGQEALKQVAAMLKEVRS